MASIAQLDPDSAELKKRIERFQTVRDNILVQVREVIVGQEEVLDQILISLFVGGHCLITGLPGTAKTLMVRTIAQTLGLAFKRIQFTPDLMPSDITGTDIIEEDPTTGHRRWTFVHGPIFGNLLLAARSIARRPKRRLRCSRPCRSFPARCGATTTSCPRLFSCWRRKIPSSLRGPIRCRRRNSTGSCSTRC